MTAEIKQMLLDKAKIYRRWRKWGNPIDRQTLDAMVERCKHAIEEAKVNYFTRLGNSLNDQALGVKSTGLP